MCGNYDDDDDEKKIKVNRKKNAVQEKKFAFLIALQK